MVRDQTLLKLERAVAEKIISASEEHRDTLRNQYAAASIKEIDFSGVGVFFHYDVPKKLAFTEPENQRIVLGDPFVDVRIVGLEIPAGFILFIVDGLIDMLEGFSFEPWPKEITGFDIIQ